MAKRGKKSQKPESKLNEYVVITFAEDMEEAKNYEALLKTDNIPVIIKEQDEALSSTEGVAVMVPEDFLDEAYVIIESQDAYDDLYDFALEDEISDDSDEGTFEGSF
jgi:hypothetical protein